MAEGGGGLRGCVECLDVAPPGELPQTWMNRLTSRDRSPGETVSTPLSKEQALDVRDAFVKVEWPPASLPRERLGC